MNTIVYPSLYILDTMGRKRVWYMKQEGEKHCSVSGLVDGQKVRSKWTTCKPKNVGKVNETSAVQQATLEIEAHYKKRKKQKYCAEGEEPVQWIEPMLAHKYQDRLPFFYTESKDKKFSEQMYAQPKLDGIRAIGSSTGLFSRSGEEIVSCAHIKEQAEYISKKYNVILDGELYNHDLKDDFEQITSLVRKTKNVTAEHLTKTESIIQYHVYDCIDGANNDALFNERFERLQEILSIENLNGMFVPVSTMVVEYLHEFDRQYEDWLEMKYEGAMLRFNRPYEFKRSYHLLKRKEMQDEEFEIDEILEGEGNRAGMAGAVVCRLPAHLIKDKSTFKADLCGGWEKYKKIWENRHKYKGKLATVTFQNYTVNNIPRFPKIKDIDRGGF